MTARQAVPTDLPAVSALFGSAAAAPSRGIIASALPLAYVAGIGDGFTLLRGSLGLHPHARVFVEGQEETRAAALVFVARRPEWMVLFVAARPDPDGMDGAFRLVSAITGAAARAGAERLYAVVPDEPIARETFFQAGFYSYTSETWYVAREPIAELVGPTEGLRPARGSDAHDLFMLYRRTTPDAVKRAEQLSVVDFDLDRGAAALLPPHLADGNPLAMRRGPVLVVADTEGLSGIAVAFHGQGTHPNVCTLRCAARVELSRALLGACVSSLDRRRPLACPVRPYDERVARALEAEGFAPAGTVMLFAKELAVRATEVALAPAIVR